MTSARPGYDPVSNDAIIVVSGLPRSGTSMMMQMLEAGGLEVLSDNHRAADESNPLGYYEDERVKQLRHGHHEWLGLASGMAVKVVSPLLQHLPAEYPYLLIFMVRSVEEILASQRRMLLRSGQQAAAETDNQLGAVYRKHLRDTEAWLARQDHFDTIYVRYGDIIDEPEGSSVRISTFLGRPLDHQAMANVVDRSLYREMGGPNS
jgi:hypothetical protein